MSITSSSPRQQFVQFYGSPKILATEDAALQELLLLTRLVEKFNIVDEYILGFCVIRVRLIRELFPSLRNEACDLLKVLAHCAPNESKIPYSRPKEGNRFTSDWWEKESERQFGILKPRIMKAQPSSKKKTVENKKTPNKRPDLKSDFPIILISGSNFNKEILEDACGYKITRQIMVERNAQAIKKIQALWNTTHMQDFGIIVCLCKHISHTVTNAIEKNVRGSSNWIPVNCFNDNVQMISEKIKDVIARHEREK